MMLRAYSIFDNKALVYYAPFFSSTDAAAIRSLSDLVSEPNTSVARHPGDYVLYFVGLYDDQKGAMLPVSPLEHVVDAVSLVSLRPAAGDLFEQNGFKPSEFAEALNGGQR